MSTAASVSVPVAVVRNCSGPEPADAIRMVPTAPSTANWLLAPCPVQAPPVSAVPHAPLVVRVKVSEARTTALPDVTVTLLLVVAVAFLSSVTVRVMG